MPALIKPTTLARALHMKPSRKTITPILKQKFLSPEHTSNHSTESLNADNPPIFHNTSTQEQFFTQHMHTPKPFKLTDFETPITIGALDAEVALLEALSFVHEVEMKSKELLKQVKIESMTRNTGDALQGGYWGYGGLFHHGLSEAGIPCLPWYW